jgi:hypothetical protein
MSLLESTLMILIKIIYKTMPLPGTGISVFAYLE